MNGITRNEKQIPLLFVVNTLIDEKCTATIMNIYEFITIVEVLGEFVMRSSCHLVIHVKREVRIPEERLAHGMH
jgi:hypothetical protein